MKFTTFITKSILTSSLIFGSSASDDPYQTYLQGVKDAKSDSFNHHDSDCQIISVDSEHNIFMGSCTYMRHPNGTPFVLTAAHNIDIDGRSINPMVCFDKPDAFTKTGSHTFGSCTFLEKTVNLRKLAQSGSLSPVANYPDLDLAVGSLLENPRGINPAVFSKSFIGFEPEKLSMGGYGTAIHPDSSHHKIELDRNVKSKRCIKKSNWSILAGKESTLIWLFSKYSYLNQNGDSLPCVFGDSGASIRRRNGRIAGVVIKAYEAPEGYFSYAINTQFIKQDIYDAVEKNFSTEE